MARCEFCGNKTAGNEIYDSELEKLFCDRCGTNLGRCFTCKNLLICPLKNDPSPIPIFIRQTNRQGNMVITQDVLNPERVEKTCKKLCDCFDENFGCLKNFNSCGKWIYAREGEKE